MLEDAAAAAQVYVDVAKSYVFPFSAALLISYPFFVLLWNSVEGQLSGGSDLRRGGSTLEAEAGLSSKQRSKSSSSFQKTAAPTPSTRRRAALPLKGRVCGIEVHGDRGYSSTRRVTCMAVVVLLALLLAGIFQARAALGFAVGALGLGGAGGALAAERTGAAACGQEAAAAPAGSQEAAAATKPYRCSAQVPRASSSWGNAFAAVGSAVAVLCIGASVARAEGSGGDRRSKKAKSMLRVGSGLLRRSASSKQVIRDRRLTADVAQGLVPHYAAPADAAESLWHHVDLHARNWLDEHEQGLFQYVNEIPQGAMQKFELQTKMPLNVIREDAKGTRRLKAFGQPFPFNYGCFPQTFRDPEELDEIHGAPGDGDPLDVLDLCPEAIGVGEIVRCRPLGAVCLIDEGQADWKILAVNVGSESPLSAARNVADAERIMPGRIEQALRWMDQFKQHSSRRDTTLHYHVLDADQATRIIEKDHAAWRRLVDSADENGTARGHWICQPSSATRRPPAKAVSLPLDDSLATVRHLSDRPVPAALAGTSATRSSATIVVQADGTRLGAAETAARAALASSRPSLTMRRQNSSNSDSELSSGGVSQAKSSGDEEKGSC